MNQIYLFCSAGMSTSMLVSKMKIAAKNQNISINICAFSESLIDEKADKADIILLGPQIRYLREEIAQRYPQKIVNVIDPSLYAKLDGATVLAGALTEMELRSKPAHQ